MTLDFLLSEADAEEDEEDEEEEASDDDSEAERLEPTALLSSEVETSISVSLPSLSTGALRDGPMLFEINHNPSRHK
jgi:hypothetical protein